MVPKSLAHPSNPPNASEGIRNRLLRFINAMYDTPTLPPAAPNPNARPSREGFGEFTPVVPARRPWRWR